MDGYALCQQLHDHGLTTHIPIILLTAKADQSSRITGIEIGADAYLAKPFDEAELHAQITMLLDQRERLRHAFQEQWQTDDQRKFNADPLLIQLEDLLLSRLDEEHLKLPKICQELKVSRSQLHKKIKAVTGITPAIYIRKIRLAQARKMLRQDHLPIAEVAYACGFRDPNYFSRVYKQEYGVAPSEEST